MVDFAHGRLRVEMDCKECRVPDDVRAQAQPELERLGQAVEEFGQSSLWLTMVFHPRSNVHHAQAKLKLPGETIVTGHRDELLDKALARCLEKVRRRIEAYKANPDRAAVELAQDRASLAENIVAPSEPDAGQIGQAVQSADYPAFRRALGGHEEWLRLRIGRWIQRYPEVQERLGEWFEIADLVEQVCLMAFERYNERPDETSMHDWLDGLIDPAIKDFWRHPDDRLAASFAQTLAEGERPA